MNEPITITVPPVIDRLWITETLAILARAIADRADDPGLASISSVMMVACGSLGCDAEYDLASHCIPFASMMIEKLKKELGKNQ